MTSPFASKPVIALAELVNPIRADRSQAEDDILLIANRTLTQ